ncbi:MAG: carboxypeptidase-like regulatory domain-containing protein, partial [bacterium]|nr:carboxypeptidase-like regulatory domain-containing protein [bacterium]
MGNVMGGNAWKNITVSGGNATNVDFDFTDMDAAGQSLAVTLDGSATLATKQLDVFCSAGSSDFQFSSPIMKVVTLDGSGDGTATMKLLGGKTYDCGVGPHMDFSAFSGGGPPPTPTFDFLPPARQRVNVVTGTNPTGITFALTAASNTITVNVCDGGTNDASNCGTASKGTGIANVYVNAMPLGCFDTTSGEFKECFGGFSQTNSSGIATLKVTPGEYEISANGPGLPPGDPVAVTVLVDGRVQQKGTTVTQVTIKLSKSSTTISGQILDESGNGIQYAGVNGEKIVAGGSCTSFTPSGGWRGSPTDSSGNYTLYVGDGTWNVRAFSPSYGEVGCTTVIVSGTSATGKNIQATAGDFGTITGTCPDGAFVNAFGIAGGNFAQCSEGTYSMKVKTGTYTAECFAHGAGPCGRSTGQSVTSSGTTTVNFGTTVTTGTVSVTITGITDAFVDVRDSNGKGSGTGQNSSGVYTIKVAPGTYTLRGGSPKYGDLCANQSVTVTADTTTSKTCAPPANLRTVTGRVTDGTSNVAGATLTLSDSNGKMFNATTGAQGSTNSNVSLTNVPDGTYTLRAAKKGYAPGTTTATVSGGNLTLSSPVALAPTSTTSGETVTISTQAGGSAFTGEGRVICTKGSGTTATTVVADIDGTTGQASADLSNGTWSVVAIGDNGKTSAASTVTVSGGSLSGSAPTLGMDTAITGFTARSDSGSMTPTVGGVFSSQTASPVSGSSVEVNVPAGALSTTDASAGKMEIKLDPSAAAVDPGADLNFVGQEGIEITPTDSNGNATGESLTSNVTIVIPYTDADVSAAGVSESSLTVGALNTNGEWETFSTTVDTTNNLLTVEVPHFSTFGILGGDSGGSPSVSDATPPAAPTNIVASGTASAVTITWTDPSDSDFDSVEVLRNNPPTSAVSGTPLSRVAKGTARFVDSAVSAGTSYTYILRAKDRSNNTRNSGEIRVTTPTSVAAAPSTGTVTAPPATTTTAPPAVTTPAAPAAVTPGLATVGLSAGDLVRSADSAAMYLVGADGKRYVFPN